MQHESGQHSPFTSHHHIPCPAGPWQGVTPCKPLPDRLGPWHGVSTCKPHHKLIIHLLVLTALMGPALPADGLLLLGVIGDVQSVVNELCSQLQFSS